MAGRLRILVVPLYRQTWCFHTLQQPSIVQPLGTAPRSAQVGLENRVAALGSRLSNWAQQKISNQWQGLQAAEPGTIKRQLYRIAQLALSTEAADDTFLKGIPQSSAGFDIIYPSSWKPALVRRRLRLQGLHWRRRLKQQTAIWGFVSLILLPVLVLPLPAVPLYYAVWKFYSSLKALSGERSLRESWSITDSYSLSIWQNRLQMLRNCGVGFLPHSWTAELLEPTQRYRKILDTPLLKEMRAYRGVQPIVKIPRLIPSATLDYCVQPIDRAKLPLDKEGMEQIAEAFGAAMLPEHAARTLKKSGAPR